MVEATEAAKRSKSGELLGTGRRKTAVARVRVKPGSGTITSSFTILLDIESAGLTTATDLYLSFRIAPVVRLDAGAEQILGLGSVLLLLTVRRIARRGARRAAAAG